MCSILIVGQGDIDDSGNYHVCITEADAQPVFEAVLNEDTEYWYSNYR